MNSYKKKRRHDINMMPFLAKFSIQNQPKPIKIKPLF